MTVNSDVRKPVLYVGEYAVEPGDEPLDLEDTGLGSGTVTYDSNGLDITFDNVDIVNTHCVYDSSNAPAQGLFLYAVDDSKTIDERLEYKMYFKGDCRINNKYFDKNIIIEFIQENIFEIIVGTIFTIVIIITIILTAKSIKKRRRLE